MIFSSVEAVMAHYPGLIRGQVPDEKIAEWIAEKSKEISEQVVARNFSVTGLPDHNQEVFALLGLMVELGAASSLGDMLFSQVGISIDAARAQGWASPYSLRKSYENMLAEIKRGTYDRLFKKQPIIAQVIALDFKMIMEGPFTGGHQQYKTEGYLNVGLEEHLKTCEECRTTIIKDLRDFARQIEESAL